MSSLPTIHVLYENPAWLPPLLEGLAAEGFKDVRTVELVEGLVDPLEAPAEGIWINESAPRLTPVGTPRPSSSDARSSTGWSPMGGVSSTARPPSNSR